MARHGQDQDNANGVLNGRRDNSLTNIGIEQASEIAQKIKGADINFDVVLTSPLQRAVKTAVIICEHVGIRLPTEEDLLIERDFGVMTGQPVSSILERCMPDVLQTDHINYFLQPQGSETFPDLMKRARKLLDKLEMEYDGKNVLLVTHGDIGQMIYAEYYKQNWKDVLKSFHFGNAELLLLSNHSPVEDVHIFKIKQHNKTK